MPINFPSVVPTIIKNTLAKSDSRSLRHYFKNDGKGVLRGIKPATNQVVNSPNNKVMTFSFKAQIQSYSALSKTELDANVLKDLHSASLISLGQVCDDGCTSIIDKKLIHVVKGNHLVFSVI